MSKRELCLMLLQRQEWVTTNDFLKSGCGSRFGARIQELRELGYDIPPAERVRDGQARYTLRSGESEGRSAESGGPRKPRAVNECSQPAGAVNNSSVTGRDMEPGFSPPEGAPDQAQQDTEPVGRVSSALPTVPLSRGGGRLENPSRVHQGSAAAISGSNYYAVEAELEWEAA